MAAKLPTTNRIKSRRWTRIISLPFISFAYLSLPFFIFFWGWLAWYWAVLFSTILIVALGSIWADESLREKSRFRHAQDGSGNRTFLFLAAAMTFALILISGIGGWGYQESDWNKHNLVLSDLITHNWPVVYNYYGRPVGLVYYIAYYLPAALFGKWAGWSLANNALVVWSAAGLLLVLYWFRLLVNRRAWWIPLIFLLFSGLDLIGWSLAVFIPADYLPPASWPESWLGWDRWDSYVSRWQYGSHLLSLFWVPNQALAAWCATAMFLFTSLVAGTRRYVVLIWALLLFWSPFTAIGLAPLLLVDFFYADAPSWQRIRRYFTLPNLCGAIIFGLLAAFYLTKQAAVLPTLDEPFRNALLFLEVNSWRDRLLWIPILLVSYILEFGIYAYLIVKTDVFDTARTKWLFGGALLWLMLIPLYVYGEYNDFAMRASIPALFFLSILVARSLVDSRGHPWLRTALVTVLIVSALNPLQQAAYHIFATGQQGEMRHFRLSDKRPDIVTSYAVEFGLARQYVSNLDTLFFNRFGRLDRGDAEANEATRRSYWLFGNSIIMEGPTLADRSLAPGAQTTLLIPFKVAEKMAVNYVLATRLVDQDGLLLWEEQTWPTDRPMREWEPSPTTRYDERVVSIPADAPAGYYRLEVYFTDADSQEKMPITALPDGEPRGDILLADYLVVGEPNTDVQSRFENIQFGDEISLDGSDLPPRSVVSPSAILPLRLIWKAMERPTADYVGFVHVLDENGQLVTQHDQQPLNGLIPTSIWQPDLTVVDDYQIVLPEDLPPGVYTLVAGMYNSENGQRLSLKLAPDNTVTLGEVMVRDFAE